MFPNFTNVANVKIRGLYTGSNVISIVEALNKDCAKIPDRDRWLNINIANSE